MKEESLMKKEMFLDFMRLMGYYRPMTTQNERDEKEKECDCSPNELCEVCTPWQ